MDSVSQILEWDKVDTSFFLLLSSVQPLFLALSSCLFLLFLPTSHFFYLLRVRGILLRGGWRHIDGDPPFVCIVGPKNTIGVTCYLDGPSTFVHKGR